MYFSVTILPVSEISDLALATTAAAKPFGMPVALEGPQKIPVVV